MRPRGVFAGRAWSTVLASLLVLALPVAEAVPGLRCQIEQGGTSQVYEFAPVADPYTVSGVDINGRFRFKAVVIGDARRIEYINLYTWYQTTPRPVLLHQAKYIGPVLGPDRATASLTGRNYLYSPGREREFEYECTLAEVSP
jgi:hypothetical protein